MSKDIHVLSLVSYKILPAQMGGQKGIALFNQYLSKEVHLTCISVKSNKAELAAGYKMLNLLSDSPLRYVNIFYFFLLRKNIKKNKISHLIVEHPYYGWLGLLLKWFCHVKLIIHSHNIEALRFKSTGKWWWKILWHYEKYVYRNADMNFFIQENDREYSIEQYGVNPKNSSVITYGTELSAPPSVEERKKAREILESLHCIDRKEKILLFNGTLNYKPNLDALDVILKELNPVLLKNPGYSYKIIICGKGLPASYNNLEDFSAKNIIYTGFVEDISIYFKGADLFINPITDGGGIKTKLVEALGYNLNVITTVNGAIGIPSEITGNKMKIIEDGNWELFAEQIPGFNDISEIPADYFSHFYWGNIAGKAAGIISSI